MAQLVKNLPAMRETWFQSLGWEDPLEKEKATHSSILAWKIPWGLKELDMTEWLSLHIYIYIYIYIYTYTFFFVFFSIMVYHRILNMVPCVIQ